MAEILTEVSRTDHRIQAAGPFTGALEMPMESSTRAQENGVTTAHGYDPSEL